MPASFARINSISDDPGTAAIFPNEMFGWANAAVDGVSENGADWAQPSRRLGYTADVRDAGNNCLQVAGRLYRGYEKTCATPL